MATYPVRLELKSYNGRDPKKQRKVAERNRITGELEKHINSEIEQRGGGVFSYALITHATGHPCGVGTRHLLLDSLRPQWLHYR